MTELWEKFANENAEYYIFTNDEVDYSTAEGQKYFFKTGEEFTKASLNSMQKYLKTKQKALEIGGGVGRLTFPHAYLFEEVHAVDVSKTMLRKLQKRAKETSIKNIKTYLPNDKWDQPEFVDYVYSFLVFQHIEDFNVIKDYILKIAKTLKHSGGAQLQFDTRPQTVLYKLRNITPDFLLPKTYKKGIRRIRRSPEILRELFVSSGLTVMEEIAVNTENHTFILRKI